MAAVEERGRHYLMSSGVRMMFLMSFFLSPSFSGPQLSQWRWLWQWRQWAGAEGLRLPPLFHYQYDHLHLQTLTLLIWTWLTILVLIRISVGLHNTVLCDRWASEDVRTNLIKSDMSPQLVLSLSPPHYLSPLPTQLAPSARLLSDPPAQGWQKTLAL